ELFQSAWSGADYQPDKEDQGIEDHTIFAINELGQYEALNQDLSGLDDASDIREVPTELEAVVQHIQQVTQEKHIAQLSQPWLPPLEEKIYLEKVDFQKAWSKKAVSALQFTIGLADMPYAQKQEEVSIDLISDGHVALFGGPSTGKTTFLQTAILDLIRHYSPEDLELYLVDFGTNGLSNFQSFPQVADSFSLDRTDKLLKLIQRLKSIRSHRKRLLARAGVATLSLYEELTGEKLSHVVVVLDNYDAMKNESFETTLVNELIVLAREGIALGMHLMLTAGRQLNVRIALHSNINTQLVLHQNDASDVTNVVGSTPYRHMDAIKGRGLMAREKAVDVVQFYLPVAAANSMALLQTLKAEAEQMWQAWSGVLPKAIPMVPDILVLEEFRRRQDYQQAVQDGHLALGLHKDTVELISWKRRQSNLLYLSNDQEHQGLFLDYALDNLDLADEQVFVFAPPLHLLPEDDRYELVSDIKEISELLEASEFRLKEKFKAQDTQKENLFVFYDFANLISQLDRKVQHHLTYILDKGRQAGYSSLILSDTGLATRIDVASKFVKTTKQMVFDMKLGEQSLLTPSNKPKQEPPLGFQEQWYLEDKKASKLQVTYIGEDNE
ncbi:FtsK/SpoIIIE domain-containing protein, partial [Streptococcus criceti]